MVSALKRYDDYLRQLAQDVRPTVALVRAMSPFWGLIFVVSVLHRAFGQPEWMAAVKVLFLTALVAMIWSGGRVLYLWWNFLHEKS